MIYFIFPSQIVMTITDIESVSLASSERIRTLSENPRNVLWTWYSKSPQLLWSAKQSFRNNYWALQIEPYQFWHLQILGIGSSSQRPNISWDDIWSVSGATPENLPNFDSGCNTEYIRKILRIWGLSLYSDTFPTRFSYTRKTVTLTEFILSINFKCEKSVHIYT